ncbi:MAG: Hsp33 family molecular chaperone HslO [Proteobacteria bacterium]|nr:Hsp33 family molecular chaperone HslO [Pseudomonadota bacterium]
MSKTASFGDLVQPFRIEALGLRGQLVRLGPALEAILGPHGYPVRVAGMVAETLALAAVLANALRFDGIFTLQAQGDGPLGMVVADVTNKGDMRSYARFDAERIDAARGGAGGAVPGLLGAGHLSFTVDQGPDGERYQGICALEGASLADCAHHYFRQSGELETAIMLANTVAGGTNGAGGRAGNGGGGNGADLPSPKRSSGFAQAGGARAAALMIQRLASADGADGDEAPADEDWRRAVILMSSATAGELLDPAVTPDQLLYRLFHEDGVRVFRTRPLRHACRCSRDKVATTLRAFPQAEIEAMAEDGAVTVTCEFCKADYRFDEAALGALYAAG